MTIGLFVPLAAIFAALAEILVFTKMRNDGRLGEAIYPILVFASALLPVILYLVLNYVVPDTGSIVLF